MIQLHDRQTMCCVSPDEHDTCGDQYPPEPHKSAQVDVVAVGHDDVLQLPLDKVAKRREEKRRN